jgi:sporulation protein YlmC with PRC-barrel domain
MLLLNSQLQNVPIMSLQSGSSLGTTAEPIIDPRKLQIVAYYVTGPRIQAKSVVHTSDIREFGPLGFIVDSADNVMELDDDLIRLKEVINFNFSLLGKTVVDDTKKRLGKVGEYTIESDGFTVQKLHVTQTVIKNFTNSNLVIHRSQIVEITDSKIIVKSATLPETTGLVQAINPFRKNQNSLASESTKH